MPPLFLDLDVPERLIVGFSVVEGLCDDDNEDRRGDAGTGPPSSLLESLRSVAIAVGFFSADIFCFLSLSERGYG